MWHSLHQLRPEAARPLGTYGHSSGIYLGLTRDILLLQKEGYRECHELCVPGTAWFYLVPIRTLTYLRLAPQWLCLIKTYLSLLR